MFDSLNCEELLIEKRGTKDCNPKLYLHGKHLLGAASLTSVASKGSFSKVFSLGVLSCTMGAHVLVPWDNYRVPRLGCCILHA